MKEEKSCGAIILRKNDKSFQTLLLKHNAGHWAFSKGHVEENETEVETAKREIKEETNLDVEIDANFRTSVRYSPMEGVEKEVIYFLAYKKDGNETPQLEEISEMKWYDINEAVNILTFDNDKEIIEKVKRYLKK